MVACEIANRRKIWLSLAELFFLDTEPQEYDFHRTAQLLQQNGWSREQTYQALVEVIAPCAASNLGFLVWPVIGEWSGFDEEFLCRKVHRSIAMRKRYPAWYFTLSDRWCRHMLKSLQVERLLNLFA